MKFISANAAVKICIFLPSNTALGFMFIVIAAEKKALQ